MEQEKSTEAKTKAPMENTPVEKVDPADADTHTVDSQYTEHDIKISNPDRSCRVLKIVVIVLLVLLFLVGGFAIWFFAYYSNPDKFALDAVENVLTAEELSLQGGFSYMIQNPDEDDFIEMVLLSFESASNELPNSTTAKLQIISNRDVLELDEPLVLTAKNVVMRDGMIYLQLDGLENLFTVISEIEADGEELDPEVIERLAGFSAIDGEWWQISIDDIANRFGLTDDESEPVKDIYSCAIDLAQSGLPDTMANLYRENRFITVQAADYLEPAGSDGHTEVARGHQAYTVDINSGKLADFINQIPNSKSANDFYDCYNRAIKKLDNDMFSEASASDFRKVQAEDFQDLDDLHIAIEVSRLGHKLRSVQIQNKENSEYYYLGGSILLNYSQMPVDAPNEYRPIMELIEELMDSFDFGGSEITYNPEFDYSTDNCSPGMNCEEYSYEDIYFDEEEI